MMFGLEVIESKVEYIEEGEKCRIDVVLRVLCGSPLFHTSPYKEGSHLIYIH